MPFFTFLTFLQLRAFFVEKVLEIAELLKVLNPLINV